MPIPNLNVDWSRCQTQTQRLQLLVPSLSTLLPHHRKLVAEIVMLRLFLLLENSFASVAAKVVCGAPYLDATHPLRLVAPATMAAAEVLMKSHGRPRAKTYLKWTSSAEIRDNLRLTLNAADPFFASIRAHAALLTEMRFVRNHVAHGSSGTRVNYRAVVHQYYGGPKQGVDPGLLLLTDAFGLPCILERYIISTRAILRGLVRA